MSDNGMTKLITAGRACHCLANGRRAIDMRGLLLIVTFAAYATGESGTPCDSKYCVCRYDVENDIFSKTVDCSYDNKVLEKDYSLPDNVYSLDLSRNYLTKIVESPLLRSETITEVIFSENKLAIIQPDALRLPGLKRLDLSYNDLEALPEGIFNYINKLEYLNIDNNKFTSFENISFHHLSNLQEIILDNNNFGPSLKYKNLFDRSGYGLTNKIISLSINGINLNKVYDNFFVDAYNLKKLIISNNNLSDVFEFPFTLEYLDLSNNPITEISGEDFADMVALKELKLNNLWIKEIQDYTFAYLHSLISLELERNSNLTKFSVTAFGREVLDDADDFSLERLSLKSSKLTTLDEKLMVPFGQLIHLDLQGNLWRCDCHLVWLKQLQIPAEYYEHLRCFTPKPMFNTRIFDLDPKYFVCGIKSNRVGICIAVVSCCLMLTAIAFWVFTVPKFMSRCHFMSNFQVPTAEYTALAMNPNIRDY